MKRRAFFGALAALCAPLPACSAQAAPKRWVLIKEMTATFDWGWQTGLAWEVEFEGRRYRHAMRYLTGDKDGDANARSGLHAYFNRLFFGANHVS